MKAGSWRLKSLLDEQSSDLNTWFVALRMLLAYRAPQTLLSSKDAHCEESVSGSKEKSAQSRRIEARTASPSLARGTPGEALTLEEVSKGQLVVVVDAPDL